MGFKLTNADNATLKSSVSLADLEARGDSAALAHLLEKLTHDVRLARAIEREVIAEAKTLPECRWDMTAVQGRRYAELQYLQAQLHSGRDLNARTNDPRMAWNGERFAGLSVLEYQRADLEARLERVRERQTVPA